MQREELASISAALRAALALRTRTGVRWVYPAQEPAFAPAAGPAVAVSAPAALPIARESLEQIRADLGACTRCKLHEGRTNIVFGVGNPKARLMFVGEGPGRDEDLQGEPFVGAAGQLLTKIIQAIGLEREDVYIANVVKSRPPNNRNPEPDEIATCLPFLERQIAAIQPAVIVGLGNVPVKTLLNTTRGITSIRGQWQTYRGISFMPTFHPSYLLRQEDDDKTAKRQVWDDMQAVATRYNEDLPAGVKPAKAKAGK